MGQKTHPLGFRLGITQEHKSKWYANFNQYANILKEDDQIRTYINTIAKQIVFQMLKLIEMD
jgi:small subunit ribosomal protein S3